MTILVKWVKRESLLLGMQGLEADIVDRWASSLRIFVIILVVDDSS